MPVKEREVRTERGKKEGRKAEGQGRRKELYKASVSLWLLINF